MRWRTIKYKYVSEPIQEYNKVVCLIYKEIQQYLAVLETWNTNKTWLSQRRSQD